MWPYSLRYTSVVSEFNPNSPQPQCIIPGAPADMAPLSCISAVTPILGSKKKTLRR